MMIMKASILKEWIRIFVPYGTRNSFYWTCTAVMYSNILFYGICVVLENVASSPHKTSKLFSYFTTAPDPDLGTNLQCNFQAYSYRIFIRVVKANQDSAVWDVTVPGITRINIKSAIVAGATVNIVLDLITLIVPQGTIWRLRMSVKKKIGVSLIFAVGLLYSLP